MVRSSVHSKNIAAHQGSQEMICCRAVSNHELGEANEDYRTEMIMFRVAD